MAADEAERKVAGFRAISAVPEQGDKGSIVKVTLVKGTELQTVPVEVK
jgi:hypothetical protein